MGLLGSTIGSALGSHAGKHFGGHHGQRIGEAVGHVAGSFLPFKKGGRVRAPRGKPVHAIVHGGEYILPIGVSPTMSQKKAVAKRHLKSPKMHEKKESKKKEKKEHKSKL